MVVSGFVGFILAVSMVHLDSFYCEYPLTIEQFNTLLMKETRKLSIRHGFSI